MFQVLPLLGKSPSSQVQRRPGLHGPVPGSTHQAAGRDRSESICRLVAPFRGAVQHPRNMHICIHTHICRNVCILYIYTPLCVGL